MQFSKPRLRPALLLVAIPMLGLIISSTFLLGRIRADAPSAQLSVDLSERSLAVIENGDVVRTYPVAVGTAAHPTPTGNFQTGQIVWNPGWNPPNSEWARGEKPRSPGDPKNPMRGVKIYFKPPAYFIHGTNAPASIGSAASHGCIRMREGDATSLANWIESNGGSVSIRIHD
ncbi:MAG: L,D-transpeptidase family protein [Gemmatimonas sp.]|nr:L,D-transpeptidase family protein [Gemmatimonas sp.]